MRSLIAAKVFEDQERSKSWAVKIFGPDQEGDYMPEEPTVAFYDFDLRGETFGEFGQFTGGSYFAETLLDRSDTRGICLHGGVDDWNVGGEAFFNIVHWIKKELNR
ncbi:MAG: hypothetical protein ACPGQQ_04520 [Candidatus Puniceispirillaceae bacterium]